MTVFNRLCDGGPGYFLVLRNPANLAAQPDYKGWRSALEHAVNTQGALTAAGSFLSALTSATRAKGFGKRDRLLSRNAAGRLGCGHFFVLTELCKSSLLDVDRNFEFVSVSPPVIAASIVQEKSRGSPASTATNMSIWHSRPLTAFESWPDQKAWRTP